MDNIKIIIKHKPLMNKLKLARLFFLVCVSLVISCIYVNKVDATAVVGFNAGSIIDDVIFTNNNSMNVGQIQLFLNSKVPTCDTWGTQTSEFGGGTRAQWGAAHGHPAPFTCLRDYSENGKSSAQIIYDVAQEFKINPQVLIVLLQKEQALVTDAWPIDTQYKTATGYGCPDTAACDSQYFGLTNQLRWSGKMFRSILDNAPTWYTPYILGDNYIQWSPNSSCGGGIVNIQNRSTQALYNYTPYQPNLAALNAGYGNGDNCSAYGNRNFYLYFTDWFGSTHGSIRVNSPLALKSSLNEGYFSNRQINFSFNIKNTTNSYQDIGDMMIAARDSKGNNLDFGRKHVILAPGELYTYNESQQFNNEDTYTFSIANYRSNIGWSDNFPESSNYNEPRQTIEFIQALPIVIKSPTAVDELRVGKVSNINFSIKNNSNKTLNLGDIGLAVRGPQGQNLDMTRDNLVSLASGATYEYIQSFVPPSIGQYKFSIALTLNNGRSWNESNFPGVIDNSVSLYNIISSKPNPSITNGVKITPLQPRVGEKTTISYSIMNYTSNNINIGRVGVVLRDGNGNNYDPRWDNIILQSNSLYTYSVDVYPDKSGMWSSKVGGFRNNIWNMDWLANEPSTTREVTFNVLNNPTITQGVVVSPSQPRVGQDVNLQYSITNNGSIPISLELTGLVVRDSNGVNLDPGWVKPVINPKETYVYSKIVRFSNSGIANISIGGQKNGKWSAEAVIPSEQSGLLRSVQLNILPNPTIIKGINFTGTNNIGLHEVSFTIMNYGNSIVNLGKIGIAVRDPQGRNYDTFWEDFTIPAQSERTHTVNIPFDKIGRWSLQVGNYNGVWNITNPVSETPQIIRKLNVDIY